MTAEVKHHFEVEGIEWTDNTACGLLITEFRSGHGGSQFLVELGKVMDPVAGYIFDGRRWLL